MIFLYIAGFSRRRALSSPGAGSVNRRVGGAGLVVAGFSRTGLTDRVLVRRVGLKSKEKFNDGELLFCSGKFVRFSTCICCKLLKAIYWRNYDLWYRKKSTQNFYSELRIIRSREIRIVPTPQSDERLRSYQPVIMDTLNFP